MSGGGLRFNEGKPRYDLVPPFAEEQFVRVLTQGASKYKERNWELGMQWSKVLASLKRHVAAFERGEDYDKESGCLHMAHALTNAAFLTEYYKIYPQGDDRPHRYLRKVKIGLDIDDVIADFVGAMISRFEIKDPVYWNDPHLMDNFHAVKDDEDFWMGIKPKCEVPFEPHCYITSRPVPTSVTQEWLKRHGFPRAAVFTANNGKIEAARMANIDIFVDDRFENFVELNNAGICCYLFDAPHNRRYDVGHKRISSLKELV